MNEDPFPYEYVSGGYFRRKGVQKGKTAEMLHGQQAVDVLLKRLALAQEEINRLRSLTQKEPQE